MGTPHEDRWLLPRRQTEYPTRELISESRLHGRREATFLAFATISLVAITALVMLGVSRIVDVGALIEAIVPDVHVPFALAVPLGVVPFALGLVAVMLACELYGRRRATALVWAGLFASAAVVGIVRVADLVGSADAFVAAVALATCSLVAQVATVVLFDAMRRHSAGPLWLRAIVATLGAQAAAWAAFGGVMYALASSDVSELALGSAIIVAACVVVATLPLAIAAHVLALFLRVSRRTPVEDDDLDVSAPQRLPPAQIVEDYEEPPLRRRAARASLHPYSSAEMRFFSDGDQLES
jgi:uncharacterized PurR-regulated membrane protein YhhQ (DUF165 family)